MGVGSDRDAFWLRMTPIFARFPGHSIVWLFSYGAQGWLCKGLLDRRRLYLTVARTCRKRSVFCAVSTESR
jgi:hypothetical protein